MLVLESLEHARERGAEHHLRAAPATGCPSDAYHLTDPDPSGRGQVAAMRMALERAGRDAADEVDYVNAHGTSTPAGDPVEIGAIRQLVGDERAREVMVSSTKSMHGHGDGRGRRLRGRPVPRSRSARARVPPTINVDELDEACARGRPRARRGARGAASRVALSNSFGFGGHNAVLAFAAVTMGATRAHRAWR